jgi:hypothetical protein
MAFNGSGVFNALPAPQYPAVSGQVIYADYFNAVINDILAGLGQTVVRDGQAPLTGNINFNSFMATGVGQAIANGQWVEYAQWLAGFTAPPVTPRVPNLADQSATTQVVNGNYLEVAMQRWANTIVPNQSQSIQGLAILNFLGA